MVARGVGRRESPVLTLRREVVRRRAHPAARHIKRPVSPQIGAAPVGCQRQIVIQADRQAALFRVFLCGFEAANRPATARTYKTAPAACWRRNSATSRFRIPIRLRPVRPDPKVAIFLVQRFIERANKPQIGRADRLLSTDIRRNQGAAPTRPGYSAETPEIPASGTAASASRPSRTPHISMP